MQRGCAVDEGGPDRSDARQARRAHAMHRAPRPTVARLRSRLLDRVGSPRSRAAWIRAAPAALFESTADAEIANKYPEVITWAAAADFTDAAKTKFASGADG